MKVFLITWVMFCCLVIVGLFIAYATDQLPGGLVHQQVELQVKDSRSGAKQECSPCEENLVHLRKVLEQQAASQGYSGVLMP